MIRPNRTWLLAAGALALTGGAGFGVARLTAPPQRAVVAADSAAKEEGHDAVPEGTLLMDAARVRAADIAVVSVVAGGLSSEILGQGSVAAAPDGQALLTARAPGAVTRIFKHLGDPVRAGETLALIESTEASSIAAERRVAASRVALARQVVARERRLNEQGVTPRQDLERAQSELVVAEAEAARANSAAGAMRVSGDGRHVVVASPISGRVTAAAVTLGAFVQPETELFRVTDPARIRVEVAVTAEDARRVVPGDAAIVEGAGAVRIEATVLSVTPSVNVETRTATVVLALSSPSGLQQGQLVQARISPRTGRGVGIAVPEDAIQQVEGASVVFVRTTTGFRAQPVTLGQRSNGRVEILQGLVAGQQIATRGAFLLKAELGKAEAEHDD